MRGRDTRKAVSLLPPWMDYVRLLHVGSSYLPTPSRALPLPLAGRRRLLMQRYGVHRRPGV
ncbi:hypothetical protein E2C01_013021 [Portunus trituberculatus]|uniref:Uncharacterized protein n=1 Tax=Portunus trituberculatus TaxID=210409 RepID=A0A5B7DFD4_PORTR|nr:hypothetical protein [Portunus trituberculatus]